MRGTTRVPASALSAIPSDIASRSPDDLISRIPASIRSQIPASLLDQFRNSGIQGIANSLTAPFRATVSLSGKRPRVTATAELAIAGASGRARAEGVKR